MDKLELVLRDDVSAALKRAEAAGVDMAPAMKQIANDLQEATEQNFIDRKDPLGVPWQARKDSAAHPLLEKSGDLRGAIKQDHGPHHAMAGVESSAGAAIYARIHQWGGYVRHRGKGDLVGPVEKSGLTYIPARPYLGWNPAMMTSASDVLLTHVKRAFNDSATRGSATPGGVA